MDDKKMVLENPAGASKAARTGTNRLSDNDSDDLARAMAISVEQSPVRAGDDSSRNEAGAERGKGGEAVEVKKEFKRLDEASFKALCDVIWPVDKNLSTIFDIWHAQGFELPAVSELTRFPSLPGGRNLRAAGFVQWRNGPCGILAAINAWAMRFYLFESPNGGKNGLSDRKEPSGMGRLPAAVEAVSLAIGEVLFRARGNKNSEDGILVTIAGGTGQCALMAHQRNLGSISGRYPGYRKELEIHVWKSRKDIKRLVDRFLPQYMSPGGTVLLLYSLVLTRGVSRIKAELWTSHIATLIANGNGYCNQELVNLLIAGHATPGIHDEENKDVTQVYGQGIEKGQDIGFFPPKPSAALLGSNLKSPKFPIWVVLAKSHYSLLFLDDVKGYVPMEKDVFAKNKKPEMVLWHYNGLNGLRWKEPNNGKEDGTMTDFKGSRVAKAILRPHRWAHLEEEMRSNSSIPGVGATPTPQPWHCQSCTFRNPANARKCGMCTQARVNNDPKPSAPSLCVFAMRLTGKPPRYEFQVQPADGKAPTPKPKDMDPWMCKVCTYQNVAARTLCQMCTSPRPKSQPETWMCSACTFRNKPGASKCEICGSPNPKQAAENSPYQCVSCSVVNDPRVHPNKCGVCGKVRMRPELCTWKKYESLPKSVRKAAYAFLPDLLTTMHILWPRTTLIYSGSQPSMTT